MLKHKANLVAIIATTQINSVFARLFFMEQKNCCVSLNLCGMKMIICDSVMSSSDITYGRLLSIRTGKIFHFWRSVSDYELLVSPSC